MPMHRWLSCQPWILLALTLALVLTLTLAGCASLPGDDFDKPEIELLGLTPIAGAGMEARFRVTLRITNPNTSPLTVNGMAYELYLRDRRVLSGVSDRPIRVEPFSEQTTELEVAAGMLGSLALLRDLLTNPPERAIPYSLRSKLSLGGLLGTVRIRRDGEISLTGNGIDA